MQSSVATRQCPAVFSTKVAIAALLTSGPSDALLRPLPQDVPLLSTASWVLIAVAAPVKRPPLACRRHLAAPQEPGRDGESVGDGVSHDIPTFCL